MPHETVRNKNSILLVYGEKVWLNTVYDADQLSLVTALVEENEAQINVKDAVCTTTQTMIPIKLTLQRMVAPHYIVRLHLI